LPRCGKTRDEGIVATRRESQTIWCRSADPPIARHFATLYELNCKPWLVPPHS
jgi:ArsR family transcriptional regulator, virulence genes transcriptional regulator